MYDCSIYDCYAIAITGSQHKVIAVTHFPEERKKELKFFFLLKKGNKKDLLSSGKENFYKSVELAETYVITN